MARVTIGTKGKYFYRNADGNLVRAQPGETVEMTDQQVAAFQSSLAPQGVPAPTSGRAQDAGAKAPDAPNPLTAPAGEPQPPATGPGPGGGGKKK